MDAAAGFAHFVTQTDAVGKAVLGLLLALSIASWYLIVTKSLRNFLSRRRAEAFLREFRAAGTLEQAMRCADRAPADEPFAALAREARAAGAGGEALVRVLRQRINREAARVEHGLALLASAGSVAPYIGLFGTVWAIYHALVNIGMSGHGTLDKVAGPVGEALIMTALGLAVAIPAAFAYNLFARRNRVWLAEFDAFAYDVLKRVEEEHKHAAG
jgi:biopolymer transport protein ExbB